jgi:pSer/pThr/pTyr-binding forkhead associated (FHA) protein
MRAQLIPREGGKPIDIVRDLMLVGRKEECDLRLDHKSISKMHCMLVKTDGLVMLRDLGSTNGTRVNGQRVRRAALLPNDEVAFANFKFRVFLGPDDPSIADGGLTQNLDPEELARLMRRKEYSELDGSLPSSSEPRLPNRLPDVYPDYDTDRPED